VEDTVLQVTFDALLMSRGVAHVGRLVVTGSSGGTRALRPQSPHGPLDLSFFDRTTEDLVAEPAEDSGFQWVPANQLGALRFPEANEHIVEELSREDAIGTERKGCNEEGKAL
jgi:hypothetical protein